MLVFTYYFLTSSGATLPYVFSPIITTGARPQAPTQRKQLSENLPSGVLSPTFIFSCF